MRTPLITGTLVLFAGSNAFAASVLSDDFENPDVTAAQSNGATSGATSANWIRASQGYRSNWHGTVDEAHGDFTDPTGEQAYAFRYTNSGITTAPGLIGTLTAGATYTVSFDVVLDEHNDGRFYNALLVTFNGGARNDVRGSNLTGTTSQLARLADNGDGVVNNIGGYGADAGLLVGRQYQTVSFSYTSDGTEAELGHDVALRFDGATTTATIDNVDVSVDLPSTIPSPTAAIAGLVGLAGLGMRRRRK